MPSDAANALVTDLARVSGRASRRSAADRVFPVFVSGARNAQGDVSLTAPMFVLR